MHTVEPWDRRDWTNAAGLLLAVLATSFPTLGALEFFRHTEADRTLIGWEMYTSGRLLVPHLLGDVILTKPPLYYWLLAGVFYLVGEPTEWAARSVSALAAAILVSGQYIFLRLARWDRAHALFVAVIVATSAAVLNYGILAEIDMTYAAFCALAVFSGYFVLAPYSSYSAAVWCGVFAALAFLTKGPQVAPLIFFGILGPTLFREKRADELKALVPRAVVILLSAALPVALWLGALAHATSWEALAAEFRIEVWERFLADPQAGSRNRPFYYYIGPLLGGLAPWTVLALGFLFRIREKCWSSRGSPALLTPKVLNPDYKRVVLYCLSVVVPALILFSLASGKSSRYILPLIPHLAPCLVLGAIGLREGAYPRLIKILVGIVSAVATVGAVGMILVLRYRLPLPELVGAAVVVLVPAVILGKVAFSRPENGLVSAVGALAVLMLSLRAPFALVYAPLRNEMRSVQPAATLIGQELSGNATVWVLEMSQRWLPYYLIRSGVTVRRLTPDTAKGLADTSPDQTSWILIDDLQEHWRVCELREVAEHGIEKISFSSARSQFALLKAPNAAIGQIKLQERFPINPLKPPVGLSSVK